MDRALELVAEEGSLAQAREAVTREVRRAKKLASGLSSGPARDALLSITDYLAARCGAAG